jgi:hypothetical protein
MEQIFQYMPIAGVTINTVWLAPAFRVLLLWVLAVSFGGALVLFVARNRPFPQALRLAALAAFFSGGILFALHADIGWGSWVAADTRAFAGKTADEKLLSLEGPFYEFVLRSRQVLTTDYALLNNDPNNYFIRRYQYFLLPLRMRENARDIVVLGDKSARFDPRDGTFSSGDLVIRGAKPVLAFAGDAYIIERPESQPTDAAR